MNKIIDETIKNDIDSSLSSGNEVRVGVSGYFDPFHVGHLEYLENAKKLGTKLIVIINNDEQAILKKGKPFMPCVERCRIIEALKCVDKVVPSIDRDRTVRATIAAIDPPLHKFCNGGDQFNDCIPEKEICDALKIDLVDGLGDKIQSSSWLIKGNQSKK